jgi:Fe-S-cluster-containing dehydrogenase component
VDTCPTRALEFGEEDDLMSEKRLSAAARVAQAVTGSAAVARESAATPLDTLRSLRGC